jgi:hypothetical protein
MTSRDRTTRPVTKPDAAKPDYQPTEQELAVIRKVLKARPTTRLKISKRGDRFKVAPNHADERTGILLLMDALGTSDLAFYDGLLHQVVNASSQGGEPDERVINFMFAVINGIQPQDQVEAMLAAQMSAVHVAAMTFARRLAHVKDIRQQDSAERAFNKLTRTFAAQMEALKRYRTGGEQKVTVQHVTVSEGGQAIVGNVTQSPRKGKSTASRLQLADAKTAPMPIIDENKRRVPVPTSRTSKKK